MINKYVQRENIFTMRIEKKRAPQNIFNKNKTRQKNIYITKLTHNIVQLYANIN